MTRFSETKRRKYIESDEKKMQFKPSSRYTYLLSSLVWIMIFYVSERLSDTI